MPKKTLQNILIAGALATAGLTSGCTVPQETRNVLGDLTVHGFKEVISHEVNPRETNVYVDNSGNNSAEKNYQTPQTKISGETYINYDMLITPEDEIEAKAIYSVFMKFDHMMYNIEMHNVPLEKKLKYLEEIDLTHCPKGFADAYREFIEFANMHDTLSKEERDSKGNKLSEKMKYEALKEGVISE